MPAGEPRIKIHFSCRWCGCQFAADRADYSQKVVSWYRESPRDEWKDVYEYHTFCPICGGNIWVQEHEAEKWEYVPFDDGTESFQRIE